MTAPRPALPPPGRAPDAMIAPGTEAVGHAAAEVPRVGGPPAASGAPGPGRGAAGGSGAGHRPETAGAAAAGTGRPGGATAGLQPGGGAADARRSWPEGPAAEAEAGGGPTRAQAHRRAALGACLAGLDPQDGLARSLLPLLEALGWDGTPRELAEALPHATARLDLVALRDVLACLGHASTVLPDTRADAVDARLLPALLVPRDGRALVLLPGPDGATAAGAGALPAPDRTPEDDPLPRVRPLPGRRLAAPGGAQSAGTGDARSAGPPVGPPPGRGALLVHDPAADTLAWRPAYRLRGDICLVHRRDGPGEAPKPAGQRWVAALLERFRGLIAQVALLTFLIYLLAVAPALFIMAVYDRVIPAQSVPTLVSLLIGVGVALAGEACLRLLRGRILARFGSRLGLLMADGLFAHLLALPVAISERMRMGARVQRLRQHEGLRDALSGQAAITVVELPFAAVFLIALALLAGPLALVPLAAVAVYGLAALVLAPRLQRAGAAAARSALARQDFLLEAIAHAEDLRLSGAVPRWQARFRALSGTAAHDGYRAQTLAALVTAIGQAVMVTAGLLTVGLGALAMMDGALSMGALIAVMTLTWRALAPIQAGFSLLTRLGQLRATAASMDQAMAAPQEASALARRKDTDPVPAGGLSLSRVSFKYAPELDPAAMALSAEIAPGEIVALTGPNGAGKSTLLKLLLGLYQPQAGTIRIDGTDLRQHAPVTLRQGIGYVPQEFELFFGTVEQNLRLSMPTASDAEIAAAIEQAGIAPLIARLPGGLSHRVGDGRNRHVPASLVGGLGLAAAYLRRPRLLLLDEVVDNLDPALTTAFYRQLARCRGRVTVLMVTHRPATMRQADRILVLNSGSVVKNAAPSELM